MDELNSEQRPSVYADSGSIVSIREFRNIKGNSISSRIEIERDPGRIQTGSAAGRLPRADHIAVGSSLVIADKISDVTLKDINFSVTVKRPQVGTVSQDILANPNMAVHSGRGDGAPPTPQGPAVEEIRMHKVELIECLRADLLILQHAHAKGIVTQSQYWALKHKTQPEDLVTHLIDLMIENGQESCSLFLKVLKEPEVLRTYPKLIRITEHWR